MPAMMSYDIPSGAKVGSSPAWIMRKYGFRINLSVWVVDDKTLHRAIKYGEFLTSKGANVKIREFSPKDEAQLKQDALDAVKADLDMLTQSIEDRIVKGEAKLAKAKELQSVDGTNESIRWVRSHLTWIRRALANSQEAAIAFGILADLQEIYDAFGKVIGAATAQWCLEKAIEAKESKAKPAKKAKAKAGVA